MYRREHVPQHVDQRLRTSGSIFFWHGCIMSPSNKDAAFHTVCGHLKGCADVSGTRSFLYMDGLPDDIVCKVLKHCHLCFMCKGIVPMPTNPGVVSHQCPHHTYTHPVWSDHAVILYRGTTDHLPQPTPCSAEHLKFARTPVPVFQGPQSAPLFA